MTQPSDQTSARLPQYDCANRSSGAKKPGEPTKSVRFSPELTSAQSPKSQSLTTPRFIGSLFCSWAAQVSGVPMTRTFSGFKSL